MARPAHRPMTARLAVDERPARQRAPVSVRPRIALGCGNFGGIGSAPAFFGQGLDQRRRVRAHGRRVGARHRATSTPPTPTAAGAARRSSASGCARTRLRPQLTTKTYNPMGAGRRPRARAGAHRAPAALEPRAPRRRPRRPLPDPRVRPRRRPRTSSRRRSSGCAPRASCAPSASATTTRRSCARRSRPAASTRSRTRYSLLVRDDEAGVIPLCARERVSYTALQPARRRLADRQVPPRRGRSPRARG